MAENKVIEDLIAKTQKKIAEANLDLSGFNDKLAFQVNITGRETGVFYVEVKDHQINVAPYEYNDRDALFITNKTNFEKLLSGTLPIPLAIATGKLKIEGDLEKAKLFGVILKQ
ncbi:hypothetical protein FACS1894132_01710 [Clostridia bacterium]|nr:hypothetical protein FACS1894132_01710 [Clostridia bacterium]